MPLQTLHSGTPLIIDGDCLSANVDGRVRRILRFSAAFKEKLAKMASRGYSPVEAKVRFQVYWRYDDQPEGSLQPARKEVMIILPDLFLRKSSV